MSLKKYPSSLYNKNDFKKLFNHPSQKYTADLPHLYPIKGIVEMDFFECCFLATLYSNSKNMNIHYCKDYQTMSQKGSEIVLREIDRKSDLLFCVASGGSPSGLYQEMVKIHHQNPDFFSELRVIKLDEWGGLEKGSTFSSEYDVQQKFIQPLQISADRYITIDPIPENPTEECARVQRALELNGPIDICILGIGVNGHIALNEPAAKLQLECHIEKLAPSTLNNGMLQSLSQPPTFGMTLGIGNLLDSKRILLFISGKGKKEALEKLLEKEVSTEFPASLLWLHPNVDLLIDEAVLNER